MTGKTTIPWPGMAIALIAALAMLAADVGFWLSAAVAAIWIGSLFLHRPQAEQAEVSAPGLIAKRDIMRDLIEPLGTPLLLIERDRVLAANKAARAALGAHVIGQDARIALRHPEAMQLLDSESDTSVTIAGFTGGRSLWQLTRRQIDDRRWLIEFQDRTAESDISRAHTDFVANASHELRTPLAAIIGYVETLVDAAETIDGETAARFHQTVLREARRMQSLVADLMSLSRVEAEKHDVPRDETDLGKLAERVAGEAASIAGKDRVAVHVPSQPALVAGDVAQLEQLVRNLIDNALKYGDSAEPVEVDVSSSDAARKVVLKVRDRGAGIAPEHLPHLTRRFYRTDPGRSRAAGGTGLGLAIVKHIVERHRATLDVASTLGEGTEMTVTFKALTTEQG
ncbi:MAG: ATP-binding protein [Novosphingobium sp.]